MPAMYFYVTWPDGNTEKCYSPSTIIGEYLKPGASYSLTDFASLSEKALLEASNRVQQKFGYHCSSAMDQLAQIKEHISRYPDADAVSVTVAKIVPA